ncbi:hypothetical protein J27TS7_08290 [Paenibacillus dendritiformis]|uniref:DUF2800 domain-containing protein n=1 Tax=Paenibacillus dendritiformis TaxID=130049 RepID=UPI001B155658|nr:DUF2800 domain-containing protein [Paenibacillus dendritiformis]GIO71315.1 hypothetical protein J27TS7_08290 [Paenibacillus dendritiformis]
MTQIAHAERAHALLSASSAHRWLVCRPSARLEDALPDTTSGAAREGTLAHEIAELKLRRALVEPMSTRSFNSRLKKMKEQTHEGKPLFDEEMLRHTDTYLEYVQGVVHAFPVPPYIAIERRVDYSVYAPEGFGTADCIIIGSGQLHIIDFKYGKGALVLAENNPQMKLYALGALQAYSLLYGIETVHMAIVQPRVREHASEWSISATELLAWGESIKPIAARAYEGKGEYVPGEHCGFCRAKETCRARVEHLLSIEPLAPLKPPLIGWEEVGIVLKRAEGLIPWYNSLKKLALAEALKGGDVPGWKAVAGRGSRDYADLDAAFKHLQEKGIDEALLYERQPLTPPALEKTLGKKQYRELLEEPGHVISKPGAPTLAPADDKRPAIVNQISPEQAFGQ